MTRLRLVLSKILTFTEYLTSALKRLSNSAKDSNMPRDYVNAGD